MAKRIAMTDEERAERRKQEQQLTEQAVAQLRCSAGWQRWLTVRGRVGPRRYTVLIWSAGVVEAACCGSSGWRHVANSGVCVSGRG